MWNVDFLVSSMLLELPSGEFALLDCGEGMMVQLLRLYPTTWKSILRRLRFVIISHSHADHHLGLPLLLHYYYYYGMARNGQQDGVDGMNEWGGMDGMDEWGGMDGMDGVDGKSGMNKWGGMDGMNKWGGMDGMDEWGGMDDKNPSIAVARECKIHELKTSIHNDSTIQSSQSDTPHTLPILHNTPSSSECFGSQNTLNSNHSISPNPSHSPDLSSRMYSEKRIQQSDDRLLIFGPPRVGVFLQHLAHLIPSLNDSFHFVSLQLPNSPFYIPADHQPPSIVASAATATFPIPRGVTVTQTPRGSLQIEFPSGKLTVFPVPSLDSFDVKVLHTDDSVATLLQTNKLTLLFTGDGRPAFDAFNYLPDGTVGIQ